MKLSKQRSAIADKYTVVCIVCSCVNVHALPSDVQDDDRVLEQRAGTAPFIQDINPQCGDCTREQGRMRHIAA